jgi:hypothetical protein
MLKEISGKAVGGYRVYEGDRGEAFARRKEL